MDALGLNLSSYLSNDAYSDLTVITEDKETFRLHRIVVCTRSVFFEKACKSNFQEGNSQIIHLTEMSGSVFRNITQFMYTGTYIEDLETELHPHPKALERVTPEDLQLQLMTLGEFLGAAGKVGNVVAESLETDYGPEHDIDHNMAHWAWEIGSLGSELPGIYKNQLVDGKIADFLSHLEKSAMLYTAAERLLMPELKILTLRRFGFFVALLEQFGAKLDSLDVCYLGRIAKLVYSGTKSTDLAIKEPLCRPIHHFKETNAAELLHPVDLVAQEYPDFSRGLLSYHSMQLRFPIDQVDDGNRDDIQGCVGFCPSCNAYTRHSNDIDARNPMSIFKKDHYDYRDCAHWICVSCDGLFPPNQIWKPSKPRSVAWMRGERAYFLWASQHSGDDTDAV